MSADAPYYHYRPKPEGPKTILFLGFLNPDHESSFRVKGFRALGYEVHHIDPWENSCMDFKNVSEVYDGEDIVFIHHCNSKLFVADIPVPVIYYHAELLWRPCVNECDILLMMSPLMEPALVYWFPEIFKRNPAKYSLHHYGVDLDRFTHPRKKYLKCTFMGPIEWKEKCFIEQDLYKTRKRVVEACSEWLNIRDFGDYEEYIKDLQHSQSTLIVHGKNCYLSQRIFEAAAASCCPIIYVDDEIGAKIYEDIGLIHGLNCLFVYIIYPNGLEFLSKFNLKIIGENARKWVETRDNIHQCKKVIKYVQKYQKYMEKYKKQCNLRATQLIERSLRIGI